jgi:hypothetical protein
MDNQQSKQNKAPKQPRKTIVKDFTEADNITGFAGTVSVDLHRSDENTKQPGELVKSTTRSGDGPFSFTWYDNTEPLYISARSSANAGRSSDSLAS